jgi:hypothetical protein
MTKIYRLTVLGIAIPMYLFVLVIQNIYGGFVRPTRAAMMCTCAITGAITCGVMIIFLITGSQANLLFLVLFCVGNLGVYVIVRIVLDKIRRSRLQFLDVIMDDPSARDGIRSVNQWFNLAVEGFQNVHPVCLDWSLTEWGTERWPNHQMTWFLHAKFIAVFPEKSKTLDLIYQNIKSRKIHGSSARVVKRESISIARQRDATLSTELKRRLKALSKLLSAAKHKLRRVWDLAIQSNISDMGEASKRAIEAIEHCDASIRHIGFVTRQLFCTPSIRAFCVRIACGSCAGG